MGSSQSNAAAIAAKANLPLTAQTPPVLATTNAIAPAVPTHWTSRVPSGLTLAPSDIEFISKDTNRAGCTLRSKRRSTTMSLHDSNDQLVLSFTPNWVQWNLLTLDCVGPNGSKFQVRGKLTYPSVLVSASFYDCVSGDMCRVFAQGNVRASVVYEKGR